MVSLKHFRVGLCILTTYLIVEQIHQNCEAVSLLPQLTDEIMGEIENVLNNQPLQHDDFGRRKATKRSLGDIGTGYR